MVSVCTVPAREGRSCEPFGGYKTINRIPLPLPEIDWHHISHWNMGKYILCLRFGATLVRFGCVLIMTIILRIDIAMSYDRLCVGNSV